MRAVSCMLLAVVVANVLHTRAQEGCCDNKCVGGADNVCSTSQCEAGVEVCDCAGQCVEGAFACTGSVCVAKNKQTGVIVAAVLSPIVVIAASIAGCAYCCKCCCFAPKEGQLLSNIRVGGMTHQMHGSATPYMPLGQGGVPPGFQAASHAPVQPHEQPPPAPGPALPDGWSAFTDPTTSRTYYAHMSGKTQWEAPKAPVNSS